MHLEKLWLTQRVSVTNVTLWRSVISASLSLSTPCWAPLPATLIATSNLTQTRCIGKTCTRRLPLRAPKLSGREHTIYMAIKKHSLVTESVPMISVRVALVTAGSCLQHLPLLNSRANSRKFSSTQKISLIDKVSMP